MPNSYTYTDTDYIYTDQKTGALLNIRNITDSEALQFLEAGVCAQRTHELWMNPITVENSNTLFSIHQYLFQDIYAWAGQRRKVEISKGGKQFFPLHRFDTALSYIDSLISEYKHLDCNDKEILSLKLAFGCCQLSASVQRRKRAYPARIFAFAGLGKGLEAQLESA